MVAPIARAIVSTHSKLRWRVATLGRTAGQPTWPHGIYMAGAMCPLHLENQSAHLERRLIAKTVGVVPLAEPPPQASPRREPEPPHARPQTRNQQCWKGRHYFPRPREFLLEPLVK